MTVSLLTAQMPPCTRRKYTLYLGVLKLSDNKYLLIGTYEFQLAITFPTYILEGDGLSLNRAYREVWTESRVKVRK